MPYKFNADHRNKIPKLKYRVANWSNYNESLPLAADANRFVGQKT
jgi:hypothetical protein